MQRYNVPLLLGLAALALGLASQYGWLDLYVQTTLMFLFINVIMCASLNLINGYMGEFSCGHAGFMCVGAYVSSIVSMALFTKSTYFGEALLPPSWAVLGLPVALLAGGAAAALAGLLVAFPSFRTRGDYLAIITLAANYIIISVFVNLDAIGGPRGFMGMKKVLSAMNEVADIPWMMLLTFGCTVFTIFILRRFLSSSFGKGVMAVSQDEIAAEIMSVNTNRIKLVAFMLSSGLAGLAGGLFAHILGYVNPSGFGILKSTEAMVMVYLGGMGSLTGSILSAVLMTGLGEALRPLGILKWVVIPLLLILLMQFRPEGIMGNRELSDIFPRLRRFYKFK
jgi:branched-chain amino acid transport system permease protein